MYRYEASESPYLMFSMDELSRLNSLPDVYETQRRQDLKSRIWLMEQYISPNLITHVRGGFFGKVTAACKCRSRSLDIDTQDDFDIFKEFTK